MQIQKGASRRVYVATSQIAGWGGFAGEDVPEGSLISEYCGELISHLEAERRGFWYDLAQYNFLFDLDENSVIDGSQRGCVARFFNHSSSPNACARCMNTPFCAFVAMLVLGELRIGIYAARDILPDEEITIDYG